MACTSPSDVASTISLAPSPSRSASLGDDSPDAPIHSGYPGSKSGSLCTANTLRNSPVTSAVPVAPAPCAVARTRTVMVNEFGSAGGTSMGGPAATMSATSIVPNVPVVGPLSPATFSTSTKSPTSAGWMPRAHSTV
jgi:hypothetical protein